MGKPCPEHDRPKFGCPACARAARSESHRYMGTWTKGGVRVVDTTRERWTCPLCGKSNGYDRFVCLGPGGMDAGKARFHAVVLCGYDRRYDCVPDRLRPLVDNSKKKKKKV